MVTAQIKREVNTWIFNDTEYYKTL